MTNVGVLGVISCVLFCSFNADAKLRHLEQVDVGLFRGSHPSEEEDFHELKALGIKTILSLDYFWRQISTARKGAESHGMLFYNIPISTLVVEPSKEAMEAALEVITAPQNAPVYVHCFLGQDRTGLAIGLYRVHVQHWPAEKAYDEMYEKGFSRIRLPGLYRFFWEHSTPGTMTWPYVR